MKHINYTTFTSKCTLDQRGDYTKKNVPPQGSIDPVSLNIQESLLKISESYHERISIDRRVCDRTFNEQKRNEKISNSAYLENRIWQFND